jgi:hypothetical protein
VSERHDVGDADRSDEAEPARSKFPELPFPPPPGKRVVVWLQDEDPSGREYEDLMLRRVPSVVAHHFRGAAGARSLTHAQYLSALVALHDALRQRADGGDTDAAATLDQLGLRTVSI